MMRDTDMTVHMGRITKPIDLEILNIIVKMQQSLVTHLEWNLNEVEAEEKGAYF